MSIIDLLVHKRCAMFGLGNLILQLNDLWIIPNSVQLLWSNLVMAAFTDSQQHLHTSWMMLTVAWNFSRNTTPSQVTWRKFWGYTPRIRSVFTNHSNAMKINQYGSNKNYCWGRLIELLINIRIIELGFGLSISSQKPKCFQ